MIKNKLYHQEEIAIVQNLLDKDFNYHCISSSWSELEKGLLPYIQHLINNDFEKLLQGLYRIDVQEEKVKYILHVESPENIAQCLTELIMQRLKEKAVTRLQYR